jgi:hypothetical protein
LTGMEEIPDEAFGRWRAAAAGLLAGISVAVQ